MVRKSLDGLAIGLMVVLCACWGLQQVAMKAAAGALHPVMQVGLRSLVATLLLVLWMAWRREAFSWSDGRFWPGIGAGILFGAEFLLVSMGLLYSPASHIVVFLYTAPIYTALGLHWWVPGERLAGRQWLGVALAFAGIVWMFAKGFSQAEGRDAFEVLLGDALGMLAGLSWAATTVLIRRSSLSNAPASQTLFYQLSVAAVMMLGIGTIAGQWASIEMDGMTWVNMAYQSVILAFASFLVWFWLLRHYLASRLSAFSFLTPLFGVAFGVALIGESPEPRFVAGAALVVVGVVLVNLRRR